MIRNLEFTCSAFLNLRCRGAGRLVMISGDTANNNGAVKDREEPSMTVDRNNAVVHRLFEVWNTARCPVCSR